MPRQFPPNLSFLHRLKFSPKSYQRIFTKLLTAACFLAIIFSLSINTPAETFGQNVLEWLENTFSSSKIGRTSNALAEKETSLNTVAVPVASIVVKPSNTQGWTTADTRPGGAVNFIFDSTTPSGFGALQLTTDATNAAKAQYLHPTNTPLSNVNQLSYYTKQLSASFNDGVSSYQIEVLLGGTTGYTTLVYEPYNNGFSIVNNSWQQWDVAAGRFWSSRTVNAGGTCSVSAGSGGPPFYTLADLKANCPSAVVISFGTNVGTFNPSYNVETDLFDFNGTVYDFEPESTTRVVDADGMASATDCGASDTASITIQAAVDAANPGDTIKVCPGLYPEKVSTNKNLIFSGPQAGVDARTGRTNATTDFTNEAVVGITSGAFNLQLNSGTTTINGFTLTGATASNDTPALLLLGGSNHQIINNVIEGNSRGSYFGSPGSTFKHNRLNNTLDGLFGGVDNITIEENLFTGGHSDGAVNTTRSSDDTTVDNYRLINNVSNSSGNFGVIFATVNSQISGNSINNTQFTALYVGGGNIGLTIQNNIFTGTKRAAVQIFDPGFGYGNNTNVNTTGNTITRSITDADDGFSSIDYRGVAGTNQISDNRITLTRVTGSTTGSGFGIRLRGSGSGNFIISGNYLDGNNLIAAPSALLPPTAGLFITSNAPATTPANNGGAFPSTSIITASCNSFARFQDGITVYDAVNNTSGGLVGTSVTVTTSNIVDNTQFGINNGGTSQTINAENNYWGSPSGPGPVGPGTGDRVTNNVDYDPFLNVPASCAPVVMPASRNCSTIAPPYNVVTEFSLGSNPNCEFSYGNTADSNRDSAFALYQFPSADEPAPGIDRWHRDNPDPDLVPAVIRNRNATTVTYASVAHPADELNLHPGENGERSVVRFTAPAAGNYQINGRFEGIDTNGTTTDVLILKRPAGGGASTEIFSGNINGYQDTEPFAIPFVTLAVGDIIDFSVGYGSNGSYGSDSTGLKAVISASETVRPTLTITPNGTTTTTSPITFTFTFEEPVTGFDISDITVTNGTKSNFVTVSSTTYTVDVTPTPTGNQNTPVTVSVPQDAAVDAAQNGNTAASSTVTFQDTTRPTLTITPTGTVNGSTTTYMFVFSEPVNGFTIGDIVVTNGTKSNFTGSGTTYTVDVTPTSNGPITISVPQDSAFDASGNGNTAASTTINVRCNNVSIGTPTGGANVLRNSTFTVPINIDDTTGQGVLGYKFTLTYNPSVLTLNSVDNAGTLSSGFTITPNNTTPGTLTVVAFGTAPLSGAGTLLKLNFTSTGAIGTTSSLAFSSFQLNEGVPCVNTTNGSVNVISGTISGKVYYADNTSQGVPNTNINASGSTPRSTSTDCNGDYSLSGFGPGPYTVTPSKSGEVNAAVTGLDASKVARYVAGLDTLTDTQKIAADVSGDGTISALDAAYIAQYDANIPNPSRAGTWVFVPANRTYPNVETNYTNQNYQAILYGDVTQNWMTTTPCPSALKQEANAVQSESVLSPQAIAVVAPVQTVGANSNFAATLMASDTTGQGVFSYSFNLVYNPSVIVPRANLCDAIGTISSSYQLTCNPNFAANTIRVVAFGTSTLNGSGPLLNLNFAAIGAAPGSISPLTIQNFVFNEGTPQDVTTDGQVLITGPTAASVSVSGRVLMNSTAALPNARVTLTNVRGESVAVVSDSDGQFSFKNVAVGQTYTLNVTAKRYAFATQVINVTSDLNELKFVSEPVSKTRIR